MGSGVFEMSTRLVSNLVDGAQGLRTLSSTPLNRCTRSSGAFFTLPPPQASLGSVSPEISPAVVLATNPTVLPGPGQHQPLLDHNPSVLSASLPTCPHTSPGLGQGILTKAPKLDLTSQKTKEEKSPSLRDGVG